MNKRRTIDALTKTIQNMNEVLSNAIAFSNIRVVVGWDKTDTMADAAVKAIKELKIELDKAQDLKEILNKLADKSDMRLTSLDGIASISSSGTFNFSDEVAVFVNDYLNPGKRVIKQEATRVVVIQKNGCVRSDTLYTKEKPDKGYSYKLIRE